MAVEPWRFCAVVADSTGNTLASRRLLVKHQIPLAIMLGDCVHHLNRGIGDIGKLAAFQSVIQVVRATVALFHKSHAGHAALKVARSQLGIGRGLEAIGKTRFATLVLSAASVQRNTPAIKKVVNSRAVTFKTIEDYFQVQSTRKTSNFESGLEQFLCIGLPVAKAIACLEALDATAADVYIYWHAILYALGAALTNQRLEYEGTIIEEVTGIMNARYRQLFEDGNIANDVYLAATYLNPSLSCAFLICSH
ncbi:hypothetical protein FA95DRAFT_1495465 [Auriscalpium vulgare]|uniref:Uncharacterized protein n=1 Tax=Auriscalpium vulgare TaxID=40419 RepID=A0ACB8RMN1_9AGAM|nr:hypothetical protein FA95DRAFT_1495465 [Auriscalpium vulgare]